MNRSDQSQQPATTRRAEEIEAHRCGYVALVGRPNVGKSTLLNAMIGSHLSAVSRKAQTTRERVQGILSSEDYQIVFIDTPGLLDPRYPLQEAMRWAVRAALGEAELMLYVADATQPETLQVGRALAGAGAPAVPTVIAINKSDCIPEPHARELLAAASGSGLPALVVSAREGVGLEKLLTYIVERLPESPALFPAEDQATQPMRFFVEEQVREACFENFHDEVPYSIACRVEEYREDQDPVYIRVVLFVERPSQRGIVIGKGGSAIREVGRLARQGIEALVGGRVYLDLRVKILPGWPRKRALLRRLGFHLPPTEKLDSRPESD